MKVLLDRRFPIKLDLTSAEKESTPLPSSTDCMDTQPVFFGPADNLFARLMQTELDDIGSGIILGSPEEEHGSYIPSNQLEALKLDRLFAQTIETPYASTLS